MRRCLICFSIAASFSAGAVQNVAIDVGHFHGEPGAMSARGRPEFEFNRDLALEIGRAVERRGLGALIVGADGAPISLVARPARARGSAFFLSVHHDSVQAYFLETWSYGGETRNFSDRYSGYSLFVSRRNAALAESLKCASSLGAALRGAGFRPSLYHAERIAGESKPFADRANGVHYYDNLAVLKHAASPAVLLEAGVIVNRSEELVLAGKETRERMAAAVAEGLVNCLGGPAHRF